MQNDAPEHCIWSHFGKRQLPILSFSMITKALAAVFLLDFLQQCLLVKGLCPDLLHRHLKNVKNSHSTPLLALSFLFTSISFTFIIKITFLKFSGLLSVWNISSSLSIFHISEFPFKLFHHVNVVRKINE